MKNANIIEIPNPANHHTHLREGRMLKSTSFFSRLFSVVVAKANLQKPVVDAEGYDKYYNHDLLAYPTAQIIGGIMMAPLTTPGAVEEAHQRGARFVANIPRGVSTNSNGILLVELAQTVSQAAIYACMSELEMPWLLHVQSRFNQYLSPAELKDFFESIRAIKSLFPRLKISIEHPNRRALIDFIIATPGVTGGIAPHYGLYTWHDVIDSYGKVLRPEIFCQPPYADNGDREAIVRAMCQPYIKGERKFRYAPDDAPWFIEAKKGDSPASGCFLGPVGPCVVAEILEALKRLDVMPKFMEYDEEFFGVPLDSSKAKTMVLEKKEWIPPKVAQCGEDSAEGVYLLKGGEKVDWQIA